MIWQAVHAGFGYFQREAGYTRTGSHGTRVHGRETGQLDKLRHHGTGSTSQAAPRQDTARAWEALEQAIIGKAADLMSGPGGLAGTSFLVIDSSTPAHAA